MREKLGQKRILLNVSQKRRLAAAAARLPRQLLREVGTLFSPDTLLKWNRWLIARKYDGSGAKKPGPAPTKQRTIRDLVLRMAEENPDWSHPLEGSSARAQRSLNADSTGLAFPPRGTCPLG